MWCHNFWFTEIYNGSSESLIDDDSIAMVTLQQYGGIV